MTEPTRGAAWAARAALARPELDLELILSMAEMVDRVAHLRAATLAPSASAWDHMQMQIWGRTLRASLAELGLDAKGNATTTKDTN